MPTDTQEVNDYGKKFEDLALDLVIQDQKPEALACPVCNGQLLFSIRIRRQESVSVLFYCQDCDAGAALLGVSPVPKWMPHKD